MPLVLTPAATAAALRALSSEDFDIAALPKIIAAGNGIIGHGFEQNLGPMSTADFHLTGLPEPEARSGTLKVRVQRTSLDRRVETDDRVAVEAPLEFQLHHPVLGLEPASFGTTMRTPGDDEWLAAGLLFGEGIVNQASDIEAIESSTRRPNVVNVRLRAQVPLEPQTPARRFSAGSSCGVCGTTGLDAAIARAAATRIVSSGSVNISVLLGLPGRMRKAQSKFGDTGG